MWTLGSKIKITIKYQRFVAVCMVLLGYTAHKRLMGYPASIERVTRTKTRRLIILQIPTHENSKGDDSIILAIAFLGVLHHP